jgi:hypothetical protein
MLSFQTPSFSGATINQKKGGLLLNLPGLKLDLAGSRKKMSNPGQKVRIKGDSFILVRKFT